MLEDMMQIEDSNDFRLKQFSFFKPTKDCCDKVDIHKVRAGVQFETNRGLTRMLKPSYIENDSDL